MSLYSLHMVSFRISEMQMIDCSHHHGYTF